MPDPFSVIVVGVILVIAYVLLGGFTKAGSTGKDYEQPYEPHGDVVEFPPRRDRP